MPDLSVGDVTLGTKETVGRYFALVSVIPSLVLAAYLYLLLAAGPLTGSPSVSRLTHTLAHDPAQAIGVGAAAVVLALVLHPLQFAMVQTLEGYTWGHSALGRELQARRTVAHLIRLGNANREALYLRGHRPEHADADLALLYGSRQQRLELMRWEYRMAEAKLRIEQYPERPRDLLPTRLGNMLRRHELAAGAAYGLPFLPMSTHVGLVADANHLAYMQDQRNAVDLAARMTVTTMLAALVTTVLLWPHGLWLLVALVPYAASYLSYRGAVGLAAHYGAAMIAVVDLNRFKLYDALHLPPTADTSAERVQNSQMLKLRWGDPTLRWIYSAPQPTASSSLDATSEAGPPPSGEGGAMSPTSGEG